MYDEKLLIATLFDYLPDNKVYFQDQTFEKASVVVTVEQSLLKIEVVDSREQLSVGQFRDKLLSAAYRRRSRKPFFSSLDCPYVYNDMSNKEKIIKKVIEQRDSSGNYFIFVVLDNIEAEKQNNTSQTIAKKEKESDDDWLALFRRWKSDKNTVFMHK